MRHLLILLLSLSLSVSVFAAEFGDSISKRRTRELSINSAVVVPVYYNFRYKDPLTIYDIKPDYNLSATFGLQYKSRRNILFEFQFQHYQFRFTSPKYPQYVDLRIPGPIKFNYDILSYGRYRWALGMGKLIKINNKNSLGIVIGYAFFSPDHKNEYTFTYSEHGTLLNTYVTKNTNPDKLYYYNNIRYAHLLTKRFSILADIDQTLVFTRGSAWPDLRYVDAHSRYFLSLNLGVKYVLINKIAN